MIDKKQGAEPIIKIVIVDDHPMALKGLEELISRNFNPVEITLASTGHELLDLIQHDTFDLAILDDSLPDMDGLDVLRIVRRERPNLSILVVSMYLDDEYGIRSLRSGARGYVTKRAAVTDFVDAVRKVLSGGKYVSPSLAEKIMFAFEYDTEKGPHERLSNREFQVMCMLGKGKTIKEISEAIHLSTNTVRTYRLRVLQKSGFKRTNELIQYTTAHGLSD